MDTLWAPWRIGYLRKKNAGKCIFCQRQKKNQRNYVFLQSRYSFCLLNLYPYNNGHVMVAPKRHVRDLRLLKSAEVTDLFRCVCAAQDALDRIIKPHGYNIGLNISAAAGAGIPGHLHIHIVPRWRGDTNFMPVTSGTKIISQSLDELFSSLMKTCKAQKT